jgi:hypothetical protein
MSLVAIKVESKSNQVRVLFGKSTRFPKQIRLDSNVIRTKWWKFFDEMILKHKKSTNNNFCGFLKKFKFEVIVFVFYS